MSMQISTLARSIGHVAHQILQVEDSAKICGCTSKGIFAVTQGKKILFFTHLPYKGPLTINIDQFLSSSPTLLDTQVFLSESTINFDELSLEISIKQDCFLWEPDKLSVRDFTINDFTHRYQILEHELATYLSLKNDLAINDMLALKTIYSSQDIKIAFEVLSCLIGSGSGLTPSGDDFLCGFLLSIHTWKEILFSIVSLESIVQKIVNLAFEKTTTLSANLIACAALGSADERIFHCYKWLHSGGGSVDKIMEELLTYGNSSGLDTLSGMLAGIRLSSII